MSNAVLIGSTAIKHHFRDFSRVPKDLDIAYKGDEKEAARLRTHYSSKYPNTRIELLPNPVLIDSVKKYIPSPNELLTLKMSHIFWDISWDKHMFDIQFLIKQGAKCDVKLFNKLYDYWNEFHGKNKRSDLTMNAKDFFNNALKEYDHDYLHTLLNPEPTYISMLADDAEVEISEEKFQKASDEAKEALVKEEVYVMAFERFKGVHHRVAYGRMLKKYLMSHAPLYVTRFILENYDKFHRPDIDFIKLIGDKYAEANV